MIEAAADPAAAAAAAAVVIFMPFYLQRPCEGLSPDLSKPG